MTVVTFSPKSRQDLLDIGDYIARDSGANARRFVARLVEQCGKIGNVPLGYASREDLAPGLRMAALDRYVIFFRVLEGTMLSSAFCMASEIYRSCSATKRKLANLNSPHPHGHPLQPPWTAPNSAGSWSGLTYASSLGSSRWASGWLANFCQGTEACALSTVNISLPDSLKAFVDERVSQRGYGTSTRPVVR